MDCRTAREELLTADPAELCGGPQTPLARHLGRCPGCRAVASRLLRQDRVIDQRHAMLPPEDLVTRALDAALGTAAQPDAREPIGWRGKKAGSATPRRRRWTMALPLAVAAAALMLYMLNVFAPVDVQQPELASPGRPVTRPATAPGAFSGAEVNAPADRSVAVFRTADPRITVVWYF